MRVFFTDKESLKKELKNKGHKKLTIRFGSEKNLDIPQNVLIMIQNNAKTDKNFIKNLIKSENNFMLFLMKIIKK